MPNEPISFVVKGRIVHETYQKTLDSVRRYYPDAEIIVSTWRGEDVSPYIKNNDIQVVLTEDPGCPWPDWNGNRHCTCSLSGVRKARHNKVCIIRNDFLLTNNNIESLSVNEPVYNSTARLFDTKITAGPIYTVFPVKGMFFPYHLGDAFFLGEKSSLIKLFDIPHAQGHEIKFRPEQYLLMQNIIKNNKIFIPLEKDEDEDLEAAELGLIYLAENFNILDFDSLGVFWLKNPGVGSRLDNRVWLMTESRFNSIKKD